MIDQAQTSWKYSFYTIIPDGVRWDQTTDSTKYPYIVDTGTTMNYLPPRKSIYCLFNTNANSFQPWLKPLLTHFNLGPFTCTNGDYILLPATQYHLDSPL